MSSSANGRLLFITRKWTPAVGGMETYSVRLTEELSKSNQVDVLALAGQHNGMSPRCWSIMYFGLKASIQLLLKKPVEITHLGDMSLWPLAVVAWVRSRGTRLVISAHGTDVSYPLRGGIKGTIYGWYLHAGSVLLPDILVIANSTATQAALQTYGYKDIRVIRLATDIVGRMPDQEPEKYILFAGRIMKQKGLSWFISSVLPGLDSSFRLKVAGTVWDSEEAKFLKNDRVDFVGKLNREELLSAYSTAMCVIIPNVSMQNGVFEGFGLVAVEAAAAGGVVLASKHGGLLDSVMDGITGFHIAPDCADEWVEAVNSIAGWSSTQRKEFLKASVYEVETRYAWNRVARETLEAYAGSSAK